MTSLRERTSGREDVAAVRTTIEELSATLRERTVKREEARTGRDEFGSTERALEDEGDAIRTERDAARTELDEARSGLDELKVEVGALEDEQDTARTERDTERAEQGTERVELDRTGEGLQTGCQLLSDFVPMPTQIRRRIDAVTTQISEIEAARQTKVAMMARLRGKRADRDRRIKAWYLQRGAVDARARFRVQCLTRRMIGAAMNVMNAAVSELDEVMGEIVGGREVLGRTKNVAFEAFE